MQRKEQQAVQKHLERLRRVKEGALTPQELAEMLTQKRVGWITEHLEEMLEKYDGLSSEIQAFNIVYFDHMGIDPRYISARRISPTKIRIESHNFCPYLEACAILGLETSFVCKRIGEQSIQKMVEVIDPLLRFSRNYQHIRPYQTDFCEEFIERTVKPSR